jgi:hypothetical protein
MPDENQSKPRDAALLQRVFDRLTLTDGAAFGGSRELIPRRRIEFTLNGADCAPGVFVDGDGDVDFTLGLVALSAAQEIKATEDVLDPAEAVMRTAKLGIETLNGAPVLGDQVDFLWEALGPGGRQLVITLYQKIGSASPGALGKALGSSVIK